MVDPIARVYPGRKSTCDASPKIQLFFAGNFDKHKTLIDASDLLLRSTTLKSPCSTRGLREETRTGKETSGCFCRW